jgi:hypothetical protein
MDINVPTIAQRKAARRSQLPALDTGTSATSVVPPQTASPTETLPVSNSDESSAPVSKPTPHLNTQANPKTEVSLDKESLIALARTMGLELTAPKKIWIKHSYSVTPESKEKFSKYCEVLGVKMQDALEESFQDWFKKREAEFRAVSDVKKA